MVLIDKVRQTIKKYDMLRLGDRVVVGVSGGPDSVVLLHILLELREEMNLSLHVAHLNHKLRSKEADKDAQFVELLAKKFKLPFTVKVVDVAGFSKKKKLTLEEAARQKRYDFLESVAKETGATKIAVGHNADDQVETILMWLLRGAGRAGLMGIPPIRKIDQAGITAKSRFGISIIRPLIEVYRKEIKSYLKKHRLSYRLDTSNLSPVFRRNKLRLKLLPLIRKDYSPNFDALILQTSEILRDENALLEREVNKVSKRLIDRILPGKISIDLNKLLRYNISLQRQIIRRLVFWVSSGKVIPDYRKVEEIIKLVVSGKANVRILLSGGLVVKKSYNLLEIIGKKETENPWESFNYKLKVPGKTIIPRLNLTIETVVFDKPRKFKYSRSKFIAHLDLEKIKLPLVVRNRHEGDRLNPLGMPGYKKVKDIFIDNKIPREMRDSIPLVISGKEVIWITGYPRWKEQLSDRVKVTGNTRQILEIRLIPKK